MPGPNQVPEFKDPETQLWLAKLERGQSPVVAKAAMLLPPLVIDDWPIKTRLEPSTTTPRVSRKPRSETTRAPITATASLRWIEMPMCTNSSSCTPSIVTCTPHHCSADKYTAMDASFHRFSYHSLSACCRATLLRKSRDNFLQPSKLCKMRRPPKPPAGFKLQFPENGLMPAKFWHSLKFLDPTIQSSKTPCLP